MHICRHACERLSAQIPRGRKQTRNVIDLGAVAPHKKKVRLPLNVTRPRAARTHRLQPQPPGVFAVGQLSDHSGNLPLLTIYPLVEPTGGHLTLLASNQIRGEDRGAPVKSNQGEHKSEK